MTTKTITKTAKFALIRHEARGAKAEVLAIGSEAAMVAAHAETPYGGGIFHSVRPVDHELTQMAAGQMAKRLGRRQAAILQTLAVATADGRRWVKPGSRKSMDERLRWDRAADQVGLERAWDYTGTLAKLAELGLVRANDGMAYAPRSWALTARGRIVAEAI